MLVLPGMPGTIHLKEHKGLEELILKHNEEKNIWLQSVRHRPYLAEWES